MDLGDLLKKTSIANVVAGAILIVAVASSAISGNYDLMEKLAYISAGYLFGIATQKGSGE